MNDESQSDDELQAHFGPHGPVASASDWLAAILEARDYALAWTMMSPDLRLVRAQAWLWNNREFFERAAETLDEQAAMLAEVPSQHPYWEEFAEIELSMFLEGFPADEYENVGIASRPRPLAPGLELVLFIPMADAEALEGARRREGGGVIVGGDDEGTPVNTFAQIAVSHDGQQWWVAGHHGETLPEPGWPPTL